MMKDYCLLLLSILLLSSCAKNDEEKIEALIKSDLSEIMNDFDSYEPIKTEKDSVFDYAYLNIEAWTIAEQIESNIDEIESLNSATDEKKTEMKFAKLEGDRIKFKSAETEFYKLMATWKLKMAENDSLMRRIYDINIEGSGFAGWYVKHSFRCKNGYGNKTIAHVCYYINPELTEIIKRIIMEEDHPTKKEWGMIGASIKKGTD